MIIVRWGLMKLKLSCLEFYGNQQENVECNAVEHRSSQYVTIGIKDDEYPMSLDIYQYLLKVVSDEIADSSTASTSEIKIL